MSKETILKEFMNLKFENKQHFGRCSDGEMIFEKVFEPLLSKAINQTREETIRELEDEMDERIERGKFLPDLSDTESYYSGLYNAYQEIKYLLNKLKK